ncbi:Ig-like domain-containing protein [Arthrobacter bambusae]|uniref:Ig-like domain-containing protein n=1 Tax=Arthrobacter bambusae TaxID=1338426 RepID=UPI0027D7AE1A|nr:hypothetical protein [Arthrobacter bambusae]
MSPKREGCCLSGPVPTAKLHTHQSINPNQTATLKPTTTPGTGPITGVSFDKGDTTKTVPGEGTWSITLTHGQPVATFTPEKDYHGAVTPKPYTVTDSNGLTAMAKPSGNYSGHSLAGRHDLPRGWFVM